MKRREGVEGVRYFKGQDEEEDEQGNLFNNWSSKV